MFDEHKQNVEKIRAERLAQKNAKEDTRTLSAYAKFLYEAGNYKGTRAVASLASSRVRGDSA